MATVHRCIDKAGLWIRRLIPIEWLKDKAKNLVALVLCMALIALLLVVPAYAVSGAFDPDNDVVSSAYSSAFNWDQSAMESTSWMGIDGKTHSYQNGFQKEYYEDLLTTSLAYTKDDLFDRKEADELGYDPEWNAFIDELMEKYGIELDDLNWNSAGGIGGGGGSMAAVALAEVGLPDSFEIPPGSNCVKYNDWYYGRPIIGEKYHWCCAFVSWCANQCGLLDTGTFLKTARCQTMYEYLTGTNGFSSYSVWDCKPFGGDYEPVAGDIMFWFDNSTGVSSHIGIITGSKEDSIECVSGNAGPNGAVLFDTFKRRNLTGNLLNGKIVHVEYPSGESSIFYFLVNTMEFTPASAAGVVANIYAESHFNPTALGDNGTSYGICQWHASRYMDLIAYCGSMGYDYTTIDGQLFFLKYELETKYSGMVERLRNYPNDAKGAYDAAYDWCLTFERPAGGEASAAARGMSAQVNYWPKYSTYTPPKHDET